MSQFDAGKKKSSLVLALILSIAASIALLNFLQTVFVARNARLRVVDTQIVNYQQTVEAYTFALENQVQAYFNELDYYVNNDIVQSGDFDAAGEWLFAHESVRSSDFDYIMLVDAQGLSYNDIGTRTNIADRDYFKAILQQGKDTYIDDPVVSRTTGQIIVHFTRAVKKNGKNIFAVVGVMPLEKINKEINVIKFGTNAYGWILTSDGTVMAHRSPDYIMKKNFITNPTPGHEEITDIAKKMIKGETGWGTVRGHDAANDLVVYKPIAGTPWSFALSIPSDMYYTLVVDIRNQMMIFGTITVLLSVLVGAILIYILMKPLKVVKEVITGIASGNADLTQRIQVKSNNEIGQVVHGFNQFSEKLQVIISEVKDSKNELGVAGEDMASSAQDTASSITQIIANIDSFGQQLDSQKKSVDQTAGAVDEISANIESLNQMIENQSSGVTQASAAVEEMIGNISSVSNSVEKMNHSFNNLQTHSQEGFSKLEAVSLKVQTIESQSEMLKDANVAIANIAEQTNLLAMNAAIEAAHAGEAGKGFAVVADEIRKLSETSSQQSNQITAQLNQIMESISEVVGASNDASKTFSLVSHELSDTDQLVIQIRTAMEEQNEGSKQIVEALKMMNDSTEEVKSASVEMQEGNKLILTEVHQLKDVTLSMKQSMQEMSVGAQKINETGAVLTEVSDKMRDSIRKIGDQIDEFKV
ncbi:MAG: HAMP domain-containing protein [Treponema sp.]|nr:HAMP domain-containing protein [Treponema sp.]